ncbi:polysaccharide deacetylase family protein [Mucilaginibacter limnophilus]|uniref:Polysaccharide deacetylase family protein n=1 Tax=Mucilaginibacter limnophilus TaxID=1932778 RepID=A0A3S2Y1A4_9SPHI|nr:polysaccharide deacetylase family protein [Mucilaginibacter limnophilus]RVT98204.1 polysaccharide deacetylase family protein [Mucilaginibacter limnophilus]
MYLVKTPWWLKMLYPTLTWDVPATNKRIYLTFDDGPIPIVTPFVLNILKQYHAKATFFCIGNNVENHQDIFNEVKNAGHAIGNHTYNHLRGWNTDDDIYTENYFKTDKLLDTPLFRPPYGRIKRSQIKQLKAARPDINIIMWSVLSGDFDMTLKPELCLKNVMKYTKPGSIVVFHDSKKAFNRLEYVLPRALGLWEAEGYTFETLPVQTP